MANDLNLPELEEDQDAPELTANEAIAALADAVQDDYSVDLSAGSVTLNSTQYRSAYRFSCDGVATSGRTVTLPAVKRMVVVVVPATASNTVSLIKGSVTLTLTPGVQYLVHTDGTANGLDAYVVGEAAGETPYDMYATIPGVMTNNMLVIGLDAVRTFTIPISLTGSTGKAGVAATGSTTLTLNKNGSPIGTLVWSPSGTTAAKTFASAVSFAVGDIFTLTGPATADATLADIRISLKAKR